MTVTPSSPLPRSHPQVTLPLHKLYRAEQHWSALWKAGYRVKAGLQAPRLRHLPRRGSGEYLRSINYLLESASGRRKLSHNIAEIWLSKPCGPDCHRARVFHYHASTRAEPHHKLPVVLVHVFTFRAHKDVSANRSPLPALAHVRYSIRLARRTEHWSCHRVAGPRPRATALTVRPAGLRVVGAA